MGFGPLISAGELQRQLGDWVVVDCRFALGDARAGRRAFEAGHIPEATFADLASDLSSPPGIAGRHPLPTPDAFERAAARLGIGRSSTVVAYDGGEGGAARLWWLLRHFGHGRAVVLDGGLAAWTDVAGELAVGPGPQTKRPREPFVARPRRDDVVTAEDLLSPQAQRALVDARAAERYSGAVETLDPVAGHIPGAHNLPFTTVAPDGRYLEPARLRQLIATVGIDGGEAAVYCGSGVTATTLVLAAERAGIGGVRLYPGSWSEWSRRGLPAER